MINKAYKHSNSRKFKSGKDGKENVYDYCSPVFTDLITSANPVLPSLLYLGIGVITEIDGMLYTAADQKEKLHFWITI